MTSNKLKLIAASIAISAAIALPAVADQPDHTLKLTIATGPSGIELIVNSVAASGAFLVYQSSTPQGLADHPSVVIQTNTPLTSGMRFSVSTAQRPLQHAFYTAVHYTNMACIPAGTFTMGSPESEPARVPSEGPQTQVTISRGFLVGKHEVTQGKYLNLMGTNPSAFAGDLSLPVETVSWDDAVAYCVALTAKERNEGRLPAGFAYRLPTEAEWEYACRAGTTTAFHFGEAMRSGMANFNGLFEYPPVKEKSIRVTIPPAFIWVRRPRWKTLRQMLGGCTTCMATSRNGAMTGSQRICREEVSRTRWDPRRVRFASSRAAVGTKMRGVAGQRFGFPSTRMREATPLVSAW